MQQLKPQKKITCILETKEVCNQQYLQAILCLRLPAEKTKVRIFYHKGDALSSMWHQGWTNLELRTVKVQSSNFSKLVHTVNH